MQGRLKARVACADQAELRAQILRRLVAIGLVFGIKLLAERLRRIVEDDGEMGRHDADFGVARVTQQLPQHVAETGDRADRQAVGFARQRRQGVIGPEDVGRTVDQEEMVSGFHDAPRDRHFGGARQRTAKPAATIAQRQGKGKVVKSKARRRSRSGLATT